MPNFIVLLTLLSKSLLRLFQKAEDIDSDDLAGIRLAGIEHVDDAIAVERDEERFPVDDKILNSLSALSCNASLIADILLSTQNRMYPSGSSDSISRSCRVVHSPSRSSRIPGWDPVATGCPEGLEEAAPAEHGGSCFFDVWHLDVFLVDVLGCN